MTFSGATVAANKEVFGVGSSASGYDSTVSGGSFNQATGSRSTVSGGFSNTAGSPFSFAAGRQAKANHQGSFVWGDSVGVDKTSSATDQFNVYAEGGMRVFAVGQSTPSMQVTAGGNVGVGTATPRGGLSVFAQKTTGTPTEQGIHMGREVGGYASSTVIEIVSADTGLPAVDFNALGSGQGDFGARLYWDRPSDTLFVLGANLCATVICPSSERFKENVTPLTGALEAVLQLEGVRFDWRPEEAEKRGFTHDFGFIAEQVQEVIPEVVLEGEDGLAIGMDYARLSAFLVEAIQQQQQTIGEQQHAFEAQQREIDALRSRASELEHLQSEIELLKTSLAALAAR